MTATTYATEAKFLLGTVIDKLAVVHRGVRHLIAPHQFVASVHVDMVPVNRSGSFQSFSFSERQCLSIRPLSGRLPNLQRFGPT